jgi:hypothetical protein
MFLSGPLRVKANNANAFVTSKSLSDFRDLDHAGQKHQHGAGNITLGPVLFLLPVMVPQNQCFDECSIRAAQVHRSERL